ncbi:hypothetical protein LIER_31950 [Lithospermum erythrorhizon]|uniref:DUF4371 domain-containing protein n=1 Tax=Lithospermum erythrorhizon TaxID=34254 RepID=A0AAV3RWB8_LITER
MKRFFTTLPKRKRNESTSAPLDEVAQQISNVDIPPNEPTPQQDEFDSLEMDLVLRKPIGDFCSDVQENVRRAFLIKSPHRPDVKEYPVSDMEGNRKFKVEWYGPYMGWMAYSESENVVFCLPCYLFKDVTKFGGESFVGKAARLLLRGGQLFREKLEGKDSLYKGHFIEYAQELREAYGIEDLRTMTCPNVQKDICCASAFLVTSKIVKELGNDLFSVLIDESGDCSTKAQMAICLRFVDTKGSVVKRFFGIAHLKETSSVSLKKTLLDILTSYQLSLSKIRGQGYDGISNMSSRLGGLKTLIQNEVPLAFYVHYFAHQLQLALVVAVSCHLDGLGESGTGSNQQTSLSRTGDTRWGSNYKTLTSIENLFGPVICVLKKILEDTSCKVRGEAMTLLEGLFTFDFIFMLSLMVDVLGVTHNLNLALQRCDRDLLNALNLVRIFKLRLQRMRDDGWDILITKVVAI